MKRLLWFLFVLAFTTPLFAVSYLVPSDEQLVKGSQQIVRGHVVSTQARAGVNGIIETVASIQVERTIKGTAVRTIDVVILGGQLGQRWMAVADAPQLHQGDHLLLFLNSDARGEWRPYSLGIGTFQLITSSDGRQFAVRNFGDGLTFDGSGKKWTERARLSASFERYVAHRAAGVSEKPRYLAEVAPEQLQSQAKLRIAPNYVPDDYLEYNFGGQMAKRTPPITITMWPNGRVQNGAGSTSAELGQLQSAMAAWNGSSAGNINFATPISGGTWSTSLASDDFHESFWFNATAAEMVGGNEGGIAAYTFVYGDVPGHISEADVAISDQFNAGASNYFLEVMTHELGHAIGFRHSDTGIPTDSNAVMSSVVNGSHGTTLQCWAKDALHVVYNGVASCTGPPTISSHPQSETIQSGSGALLSVTAANGCNFMYQWFKGTSGDTSQPIAGANSFQYSTPALTSNTNYWVKVGTSCGFVHSNTATITVQACNPVLIINHPQSQTILSGSTATLNVTIDTSASTPVSYQWYNGSNPINGATAATYTTGVAGTYKVRVTNPCGFADSNPATITVTTSCTPPSITSVTGPGTVVGGTSANLAVAAAGTAPLSYQWYNGASGDTSSPIAGATSSSYATPPITATKSFWVKVTNSCGSANSNTVTVALACSAPTVPMASAPAEVNSGQPYFVKFLVVANATNYDMQESTDPTFGSNVTTQNVQGSTQFTHTVTTPTRFYYRVRAKGDCGNFISDFSIPVNVAVILTPSANDLSPNVSVPEGSTKSVTINYFVPAPNNAKTALDTNFGAGTDKPFATVSPSGGTIPPNGTNLAVTVNPTNLPAGANTATVSVTATGGSTIATTPVTVSLVAPISPQPKGPALSGLMIPVVGHAQGGNNSLFLSDVRLLNASSTAAQFTLTFTPSGPGGFTSGKQMTLSVSPLETKALNDLVKTYFGQGSTGESAVGILDIRAVNGNLDPAMTFASSRTYNITSEGTFGQFIPAIPYNKFIGKAASGPSPRLTLQQIAQSTQYRTNFGIVEGAGEAATAQVRIFNDQGTKVGETTINLQAFEHRQINGFLALNGVSSLSDGRIEVEVTSASGKVSAYASVVDNLTNDPLLVSPEVVGEASAFDYVVPGVADITNPNANWRSDVRIFNSSGGTVNLELTFYPQAAEGKQPTTKSTTVGANSVLALDNILQSFFGITNSGGALHVRTTTASSLVVTARTYDSRVDSNGAKRTYGQFIPAVSPKNGTKLGDRPLQVMQIEESSRFRSHLGITELAGKPVTVEVTAYAPDIIAAPVMQVQLGANEFVQLTQILKRMNLNTTYNARVSVKVIGGEGRITAYASVIDNTTQDPTYVPAQ